MRQVTPARPARRWGWGLSGIVTAVLLATPIAHLVINEGVPVNIETVQPAMVKTVTIGSSVTSLLVRSYGAPVSITAAAVGHVQAVEVMSYDPKLAGPPAITQSVWDGRLTLEAPSCAYSDCSVSFNVTVPLDVTATVDSQGGPVTVSGIASGYLDSDGGPVRVMHVSGPLTVTTVGGPLRMDDVKGRLNADTGGGPAMVQGLTAPVVVITTGGGEARVVFAAAPTAVTISTNGGPALVTLPGGPYSLTTESDGGSQLVTIPTDPAATREVTIVTGGGFLQLTPHP